MTKEKRMTCLKGVSVNGLIGFVIGAVLGEYTNIGGTFWNLFDHPFSEYRNRVSLRYALIGLLIGAIAGAVVQWINHKPADSNS